MGMRSVFAAISTNNDGEKVLDYTTVQWASYIPRTLAYGFSHLDGEGKDSLIDVFVKGCQQFDHMACIDRCVVNGRYWEYANIADGLSVKVDEKNGQDVIVGVDSGFSDGSLQQQRKVSGLGAAKEFVARHGHNQDGVSALYDPEKRTFHFISNNAYHLYRATDSEDSKIIMSIPKGEWVSYSVEELARLGGDFDMGDD